MRLRLVSTRPHRLESRMRENRPSGSEGGAGQLNAPFRPRSLEGWFPYGAMVKVARMNLRAAAVMSPVTRKVRYCHSALVKVGSPVLLIAPLPVTSVTTSVVQVARSPEPWMV